MAEKEKGSDLYNNIEPAKREEPANSMLLILDLY